jgi:peptidoglycan/xylan/chitin deacetylase (PgdA/CDA1 family)
LSIDLTTDNTIQGGERSVLLGDGRSETSLREYPAEPDINERSYSGESEFEYGSRRGWWRLFKLFNDYKMKFTLYAVGSACEEQPEVVTRCVEEGHDVASHAYRWIDHKNLSPEAEKQHIRDGITALKKLAGYAPKADRLLKVGLSSRPSTKKWEKSFYGQATHMQMTSHTGSTSLRSATARNLRAV